MKIAPKPNEDAPLLVVAVQDLIPDMAIMYLEPYDGYDAGYMRPVLAVNPTEETVICNGWTPKDWRLAVENEDFGSEILYRHLPSTIEEIRLSDYRNKKGKPICQLVILNTKTIPVPVPVVAPQRVCKVITHPASQQKPAKQEPKTTVANVLPLFPDYNVQPQKIA